MYFLSTSLFQMRGRCALNAEAEAEVETDGTCSQFLYRCVRKAGVRVMVSFSILHKTRRTQAWRWIGSLPKNTKHIFNHLTLCKCWSAVSQHPLPLDIQRCSFKHWRTKELLQSSWKAVTSLLKKLVREINYLLSWRHLPTLSAERAGRRSCPSARWTCRRPDERRRLPGPDGRRKGRNMKKGIMKLKLNGGMI